MDHQTSTNPVMDYDDPDFKTFLTSADAKSMLSEDTTSSPPEYSENTDQQVTQNYQLSWDNVRGTAASIYAATDTERTTPLYTIFCNMPTYWKFSVIRPDPDASKSDNKKNKKDLTIGDIKFHWTSCKIDLNLHSQPLLIKSCGLLTKKFKYTSPSFPNNPTISWKYHCGWKRWDVTCFDEQKRRLAKIEIRPFGYKNAGNLQLFFDEHDLLGDNKTGFDFERLRDEIVVTGMAVAEFYYLLNTSPVGVVVAVA